jgi:hypothetical protein
MLAKVDWMWFLIGMAFAMFVLPMLTRALGSLKGKSSPSTSA